MIIFSIHMHFVVKNKEINIDPQILNIYDLDTSLFFLSSTVLSLNCVLGVENFVMCLTHGSWAIKILRL